MTDAIEFAELNGVEIFSVGRWRGSKTITVTRAMLDEMVQNFEELSDKVQGYRPPIKLGHTEAQRFMGQNGSGLPALGWMRSLVRVDDKLVADFSDVPSGLLDLIKRRLYNSVSIEILPKVEFKGKTFSNVLAAVAVLGAELPAVKGLKELSASLFDAETTERIALSEKEQDMPGEATFTQAQVDGLIEVAVNKALAKFTEDNKAAMDALTQRVTDSEKATADAVAAKETAETALAVFKEEGDKREIEALVDQAIKDGKVLPKDKDATIAMASGMVGTKVKFGDKEKSGLTMFKEFIGNLPKAVKLSEKGGDSGKREGEDGETAAQEVDRLAKAKVKESAGKLSYKDAMTEVFAEDEDLKQRYVFAQ